MAALSLVNVTYPMDFAVSGAYQPGIHHRPLTAEGLLIPRIILFDDDPLFSRAIERVARRNSIPLVSVSVPENVSLADQDFDLAIVDFDLGDITGVELAQSLESTFANLPIVMVSYTERQATAAEPWPKSVRRFVLKDRGPAAIIDEAIDVYNWRSALPWRHWERRLKLIRKTHG